MKQLTCEASARLLLGACVLMSTIFVKKSGLVYAMQGVGRAHWHKTQNK